MNDRTRDKSEDGTWTIPDPSQAPRDAVKALARAALIFRSAFLNVGEGRPIRTILEEHQETLLLADAVIDKWLAFLGIDCETGEDIS
jgi:hypothetical protein